MTTKIDVLKEIQVHSVMDGPAKGWTHTHGLQKFGKPELEIRNVPTLFIASATRLLNEIADYMLNHASHPVLAGQKMQVDRVTIVKFHQAEADQRNGYDENHYETLVLRVDGVDMPCSCCTPKVQA